MKNFLFLIILSILWGADQALAARIYLEAPTRVGTNGEPVPVLVYLDPEGDVVSGVGGEFTFRSDSFVVKNIIAGNTSIPLWVTPPKIAEEKYIDNKTHIVFDGIIPGGFRGVLSSRTKGSSPGLLFIINLVPKKEGISELRLEEVQIRAFDETATLLSNKEFAKRIFVPKMLRQPDLTSENIYSYVSSPTLSYTLDHNDAVSNGGLYMFVFEHDSSLLIDHIAFAESGEYSPFHIEDISWHVGSNPYVLLNQSRHVYVHAKVFYTNKTYTYVTLPPVENSSDLGKKSRILVYIVIVMTLLYHYGKHYLPVLVTTKKTTK
jgi:hypothetical protein